MSGAPVTAIEAMPPFVPLLSPPGIASPPTEQNASFGQMLLNGVESVNTKMLDADKMVRAFAIDDSIPVHQVTFALEQARLSLELMLQVRGRLVEGYQQLMNMQL